MMNVKPQPVLVLAIAAILFCSMNRLRGQVTTGAKPATASTTDQPLAGDVPRGKTFSFQLDSSRIFPGTRRQITVYVPHQYTADRPACVYVGFDGLGFAAPAAFDELIAKKEMPITIGIGVSAGEVPAADAHGSSRFDRSVEFDSLNDSLPRFLLDEVFPAVISHRTPDGLLIKLSPDPNDRCTGGASTGGIAAFTCAWERPDQFRRVFTAIGTFVDMRGGNRYPILVRETDPKPIRIFQQDNSSDEWDGGPEVGDWWIGNQALNRALDFAGYEHQQSWGDGGHSGQNAERVFPDAMRFLWKDWPQPVRAHSDRDKNLMLRWTIDPAAAWQSVADAPEDGCSLITSNAGDLLVQSATGLVRRLGDDGKWSDFSRATSAFALSAQGKVITGGKMQNDSLVVNAAGDTYRADPTQHRLVLIHPDGTLLPLTADIDASAIAISPDGCWLAVMERGGHTGRSCRVRGDGTLDAGQNFYWLQQPDIADNSDVRQIVFDRDGHLFAATNMGVQVMDRNGRSRAVLPLPTGGATAVAFAGQHLDTLYAISGGKLFSRKTRSIGWQSTQPPIKLPPWGPG